MSKGRNNTTQRGDTMRVSFETSGGFENALSWLRKTKDRIPTSALNNVGRSGVAALKSATPTGETGGTAAGWDYQVDRNSSGAEVSFTNNAHPGESVNVAKIIELGHGTGTGGYVPPNPYIKQAMAPVFSKAGDQIAKEMFK